MTLIEIDGEPIEDLGPIDYRIEFKVDAEGQPQLLLCGNDITPMADSFQLHWARHPESPRPYLCIGVYLDELHMYADVSEAFFMKKGNA